MKSRPTKPRRHTALRQAIRSARGDQDMDRVEDSLTDDPDRQADAIGMPRRKLRWLLDQGVAKLIAGLEEK